MTNARYAMACALGALAMWLASTSAERLERLTNFVDPFKDYQGAGWQPAHGLFAMSSGGWFGSHATARRTCGSRSS